MKGESWRIRFWRQLYRLYKSNGATSEGFRHRITAFGYLVIICFSIALTLRLSSANNSLFGLVAFLAAIGIFSIVLVFYRRVSLSIHRELPKVGTVGEELRYEVIIKNSSVFRLVAARIVELPQSKDSGAVLVDQSQSQKELLKVPWILQLALILRK